MDMDIPTDDPFGHVFDCDEHTHDDPIGSPVCESRLRQGPMLKRLEGGVRGQEESEPCAKGKPKDSQFLEEKGRM